MLLQQECQDDFLSCINIKLLLDSTTRKQCQEHLGAGGREEKEARRQLARLEENGRDGFPGVTLAE